MLKYIDDLLRYLAKNYIINLAIFKSGVADEERWAQKASNKEHNLNNQFLQKNYVVKDLVIYSGGTWVSSSSSHLNFFRKIMLSKTCKYIQVALGFPPPLHMDLPCHIPMSGKYKRIKIMFIPLSRTIPLVDTSWHVSCFLWNSTPFLGFPMVSSDSRSIFKSTSD